MYTTGNAVTCLNLLSGELSYDNVAQAKHILKNINSDWAKNAFKLLSGDFNFERIKQAKEIVVSNTPESSTTSSTLENTFKYSNLSGNGEKGAEYKVRDMESGDTEVECPIVDRVAKLGEHYFLQNKTSFDQWKNATPSSLLPKRKDFGKAAIFVMTTTLNREYVMNPKIENLGLVCGDTQRK
mgnify:CR=1 FL=1